MRQSASKPASLLSNKWTLSDEVLRWLILVLLTFSLDEKLTKNQVKTTGQLTKPGRTPRLDSLTL